MRGRAIWQGVLAAANTVVGSSLLLGLCGPKVAGSITLIVAAAISGTSAYEGAIAASRRSRDTTDEPTSR